jgi:hypothetical protein
MCVSSCLLEYDAMIEFSVNESAWNYWLSYWIKFWITTYIFSGLYHDHYGDVIVAFSYKYIQPEIISLKQCRLKSPLLWSVTRLNTAVSCIGCGGNMRWPRKDAVTSEGWKLSAALMDMVLALQKSGTGARGIIMLFCLVIRTTDHIGI